MNHSESDYPEDIPLKEDTVLHAIHRPNVLYQRYGQLIMWAVQDGYTFMTDFSRCLYYRFKGEASCDATVLTMYNNAGELGEFLCSSWGISRALDDAGHQALLAKGL